MTKSGYKRLLQAIYSIASPEAYYDAKPHKAPDALRQIREIIRQYESEES